MSYTYAGQYGAQQVINATGVPQPSTPVTVYLHNTNTPATLYTDRTKATVGPNPVSTDALGNLTFYANPGTYDLAVRGMSNLVSVLVPDDPQEVQTGAYEPLTAMADSATVYWSPADGVDSRSGTSWGAAVKTYAAALALLPTVNSSPVGKIMVAQGTATVTSSRRRDAVTFTQNSAVVTDASAAAGDVGKFVSTDTDITTGTVPLNTTILSVVAGVSFTMSANAALSGTGHAFLDAPAITVPPGVEIEGRAIAGWKALTATSGTVQAVTVILDNGNGITVRCTDPGLANESRGYGISNVMLNGNSTAYQGIYFGDADNDLVLRGVNACYYTNWGLTISSGGSYGAYVLAEQCHFDFNGTAAATVATGGIDIAGGALTNLFINCHTLDNYGFGVYHNSGGTSKFINCEINVAKASTLTDSGSGVYVKFADQIDFDTCWFEDNAHGMTVYNGNNPTRVGLRNCQFSGDGTQDYGIITKKWSTDTYRMVIDLDRCTFGGHSTGWGINNTCPTSIVRWKDAQTSDSNGLMVQGAVSAALALAGSASLGAGLPGTYVAPPSASQTQPANGTMIAIPVFVADTTITSLSIRVTVSGDGTSLVRLGVYSDDMGTPGALLLDAGTISASTTGYKTATVALTVQRGIVWLACAVQGVVTTAPNLQAAAIYQSSWTFKTLSNAGVALSGAWSVTGVTGALPASFGGAESGPALQVIAGF